jgi:3-oxoacid CoA-transferase subunit B
MDRVAGAKRTVVVMEHCTKTGEPRIRRECTLALTGRSVLDRLITDLGVFHFTGAGEMVLVELSGGASTDELREKTEGNLVVAGGLA